MALGDSITPTPSVVATPTPSSTPTTQSYVIFNPGVQGVRIEVDPSTYLNFAELIVLSSSGQNLARRATAGTPLSSTTFCSNSPTLCSSASHATDLVIVPATDNDALLTSTDIVVGENQWFEVYWGSYEMIVRGRRGAGCAFLAFSRREPQVSEVSHPSTPPIPKHVVLHIILQPHEHLEQRSPYYQRQRGAVVHVGLHVGGGQLHHLIGSYFSCGGCFWDQQCRLQQPASVSCYCGHLHGDPVFLRARQPASSGGDYIHAGHPPLLDSTTAVPAYLPRARGNNVLQ